MHQVRFLIKMFTLCQVIWIIGCTAVSTQPPDTGPTVSATDTPLPPTAPASATATTIPSEQMGNENSTAATPLDVTLEMSHAPGINETAEFTFTVQAYMDAPGTTANIELPPGVQLVEGELTWEGDLTKDNPLQRQIKVIFTETGEYSIRGRALSVISEDMIWGDEDYIYLTVKSDGSFFGLESGDNPEVESQQEDDGG